MTGYDSSIISYETLDLKLAALLLSEIPDSNAEVFVTGNTTRKTFRISFPKSHRNDVHGLINDFINRQARVDVFAYNKNLSQLRTMMRQAD